MLAAAVASAALQSTGLLQQAAPCLVSITRNLVCRSKNRRACCTLPSSISSSTCTSTSALLAASINSKQQTADVGTYSSPIISPTSVTPVRPARYSTARHVPEHAFCSAPQSPCSIAAAAGKLNKQLLFWQQSNTHWNTGLRQYCQNSQIADSSQHGEAAAADSSVQQRSTGSSASEAASSFISANPAATGGLGGAPSAAAASASAAAAAAASVGGVLPGVCAASLAEYTMRQVSKHASDETCWIVVNGKVYDVTSYIDDHPGGAESILQNAGVDCTEEFMGVHSQEAKDLLEKFVIGTVKAGHKKPKPKPAVGSTGAAAAALKDQPTLLADPTAKYALPLAEKKQLNHDTFFMRFTLPGLQQQLGLPCGKHVFLSADIGGETIVRAYTPISGDHDLGVLDFLIKVYWAGVHPQYPQGGKMTQHLAAMKEGDTIDVKGPYGKFSYGGQGNYTLNRVAGKARYLSMISGGSGVTPCYSVLREVLADPNDQTRCALIYANKHEEDIWLKKELDAMARDNPDRFHLWYVVEEPGTSPTPLHGVAAAAATAATEIVSSTANMPWTYSKGYITHDMMAQHLLPPHPLGLAGVQQAGALALMCGPPGMLENVVVPGLTALGYTAEQMVVF